jgi:hypothetical protein
MRLRFATLSIVLLLLASLSFAASWISIAALAIVTSAVLLALVYMLGVGFDINELKFLAHEELYQLLVTVILVAILVGAQQWIDSLGPAVGMTGTLQDGAIDYVNQTLGIHKDAYSALTDFSIVLGKESSKSYYCSLEGVGFTASPCNAFRALTPPVSTSFQALSISITELNSLFTLLNFSKVYAFTLLLPLGILLRTFKASRGAGGIFIGLAVALYLFLPIGVAFMKVVLDPSIDSSTGLPIGYDPAPTFGINGLTSADLSLKPYPSCEETDYGTFNGGVSYGNLNKAISTFKNLESKVDLYLYLFLIRGTMLLMVSLLTFYASFRAVSKLGGAEVDLSALARIA